MAGIDKIYGSYEQWDELRNWLADHYFTAMIQMYGRDDFENADNHPLTNFSSRVDRVLWKKCRIPWVRKRLEEQYPQWRKKESYHE